MFAALPMYDFESLREATDALWAAIRDSLRTRGFEAPDALTRGGDIAAQWRDSALLFGQTCGYPFWMGLREHLEVLAAPIYNFRGCGGPSHGSFLVARKSDRRNASSQFRGARAAINAHDSNTGMNLFRAAIAPLAQNGRFFGEVVVTGAHAASLEAVRNRKADIAAIDAVTYGLLRPEGVKIIGHTPSSPTLPFVTSRATPPAIRAALREALRDLAAQPELGLAGVAFVEETAYARVEAIEREAAARGYPRLA